MQAILQYSPTDIAYDTLRHPVFWLRSSTDMFRYEAKAGVGELLQMQTYRKARHRLFFQGGISFTKSDEIGKLNIDLRASLDDWCRRENALQGRSGMRPITVIECYLRGNNAASTWRGFVSSDWMFPFPKRDESLLSQPEIMEEGFNWLMILDLPMGGRWSHFLMNSNVISEGELHKMRHKHRKYFEIETNTNKFTSEKSHKK